MADFEDKDQKTEEATPRRVAEAREKGQVALSTELIAAIALAVGVGALVVGGGALFEQVGWGIVTTMTSLDTLGKADLSAATSAALIEESLTPILGTLALVTLPAIILSALAGYAQVEFQIAPRAMEPDLTKFDLIKGVQKLVSMRSVVRTTLSFLKVVSITTVVVIVAWANVGRVVRVSSNELGPVILAGVNVALRCVFGALVVILVLSIADLLYQRFQHAKDLRMSKHELKEEHKQTEGDPRVKGRIRRVQQEIALGRMMADVPEATVVVTNPTHYAVALRYDRDGEDGPARAPIVVAKGVDHLAQRIKSVARENDVPCYEDVPLARALHAQVEVGEEIPEELYAAVATVLGYVYRIKGMVPGAAVSA